MKIPRPPGFPCNCEVEVHSLPDRAKLICTRCGKAVEGMELAMLLMAPKPKTFDADAHRNFMKSL